MNEYLHEYISISDFYFNGAILEYIKSYRRGGLHRQTPAERLPLRHCIIRAVKSRAIERDPYWHPNSTGELDH